MGSTIKTKSKAVKTLSSSPTISNQSPLNKLSANYLTALRAHLNADPQESMIAAQNLGLQAVALKLETLDIAKLHKEAVTALISPKWDAIKREVMTNRSQLFFNEVIKPIEDTHLAATESYIALNQVRLKLNQRTEELTESNKELQEGIQKHQESLKSLQASKRQFTKLLGESRQLEALLRSIAHRIFATNEEERTKISLQLNDDIAQTLLGVHVRLLALRKKVSVNQSTFSKDISTTQQMVDDSMESITQFAKELSIAHAK